MSLRTRRSLALLTSLMFFVVACTGGATPTQAPTSSGPSTPAPITQPPSTPAPGDTDPPVATGAPATDPGATGAPATDPGATDPPVSDLPFRLYLSDTDPATTDPNSAEDSVSISILTPMHRGLMYFTPELGVVPALAESVTNNADFTEFTFKLKPGITYSDGTAIVAGDFVYSWQRLVTPSLATPYGYLLCIVEGADQILAACGAEADAADEDVAGLLGVSAPDESTFVVTLTTPATFFLSIAAMWPTVPLSKTWVDSAPFGEAAGQLSSGPYVMSQWDHNSLIRLDPNPAYTAGPAATTSIEFSIGGAPDAAFVNFEQGLLDAVSVPSAQLRRVLDDPTYAENYTLVQQQTLGITYYGFATCIEPENACPRSDGTQDGRSPTANQNFRIALTQAIDKQQLIDLTFGGTGAVANSFVMPGLLGSDPDYNPYPFDPTVAAAVMQTALDELGIDPAEPAIEGCDDACQEAARVPKLGTISIGYNSNADHLPRVVNLAEQWRKNLGFDEAQFDLIGVDFPTLLQQRQAGEYMISRNGWGADFPHPDNQLRGLFTCGGTNNDEQWCDPAFDDLVNQGAQAVDSAEQDRIYREAQRILLDAAAMLPLRFGLSTFLVQPWVNGIQATPSDHQNIGDVFLENITIAPH